MACTVGRLTPKRAASSWGAHPPGVLAGDLDALVRGQAEVFMYIFSIPHGGGIVRDHLGMQLPH